MGAGASSLRPTLLVLLRAPPLMQDLSREPLRPCQLRPLALVVLDEQLQLLATVPLLQAIQGTGDSLPGSIAWAEIHALADGGALVVMGGATEAVAPWTSLLRLQLSDCCEEDSHWLDSDNGGTTNTKEAISVSVAAISLLRQPVVVASNESPSAPIVVAAATELQFLHQGDLTLKLAVPLIELGLQDRGVISSACLACGHPSHWTPIVMMAAGAPTFMFLGFSDGPPALLQLDMLPTGLPALTVLRMVPGLTQPLPPVTTVVAFGQTLPVGMYSSDSSSTGNTCPPHSPSTSCCGFVAFDAAGCGFTWTLCFDTGPLARPSVEMMGLSCSLPLGPCGPWSLGSFGALASSQTPFSDNLQLCMLPGSPAKLEALRNGAELVEFRTALMAAQYKDAAQ